jgi:hypothetical protein
MLTAAANPDSPVDLSGANFYGAKGLRRSEFERVITTRQSIKFADQNPTYSRETDR